MTMLDEFQMQLSSGHKLKMSISSHMDLQDYSYFEGLPAEGLKAIL
jgi:hypothetical protein